MGTHGIAEFLKFAVDGVLAKARLKGQGIWKILMSSEKRWMRFQPFARLVPPLEMTPESFKQSISI
jgi:hypothetical protein